MPHHLTAGSAVASITPEGPHHLFGYPHVDRYSTGVHDPLLSSALYLCDGQTRLLVITNDVIFVPKEVVARARRRIDALLGVPSAHILVSATHTHSGPSTVRYVSNDDDPFVPDPEPGYLQQLEDAIIAAAQGAVARACEAELGLALADGSNAGTNRHDLHGPSDPEVPVLVVRRRHGGTAIAVMLVCSMHPTVLHEDSTEISGDFPAMTRAYLQERVLGKECPVLHHTGAAGNQSPRHVTHGNTFSEAERIGHGLGDSIERAMTRIAFLDNVSLGGRTDTVELPLRSFPDVREASQQRDRAEHRFDKLRSSGAPRAEVRTAECDVFGARESLTLARAASAGRLAAVAETCRPAEIQVMAIGPWTFVAWPGELFVEFALEIKSRYPNTYVICLANGELQGYLVTSQAVQEGWYEAANALFRSPESGQILVEATQRLLAKCGDG